MRWEEEGRKLERKGREGRAELEIPGKWGFGRKTTIGRNDGMRPVSAPGQSTDLSVSCRVFHGHLSFLFLR